MHGRVMVWKRLMLTSVAFAALLLLGTGCEGDVVEVEAELVAPPAVPEPIERGRAHVTVALEVLEKEIEIAPGVSYTAWTFNGSVPGPMIRVRRGDQVTVSLANPKSSVATHNIDLHAVNGPGGGAGATTVAPGETKAFEFKAMTPGLYVYHCAAGIVADHIGNGMWGAILVEPTGGLPKVDREFYVGQGEYYTTGDTGAKGKQQLDSAKLIAEQPTYVTFNGSTTGLAGPNALQARVGDRVRIFFANGGPNFTSSFHVIGEIFDRVRNQGSISSIMDDVQTITVPPGGAVITEFKLDVPGDYKLVDHAISRVSKGGLGTLHVEGPAHPDIFRSSAPGAAGHDMTATATQPAATASPSTGTPGNSFDVVMKDNLFEPNAFTVKSGERVTFNLRNTGTAVHNMRIADAAGSYDGSGSVASDGGFITGGKTAKLEWAAARASTYKFRCDVHPDQMTGTISSQ